MEKISLKNANLSFDVTYLEGVNAKRIVLFAVGAGGNPERHLPLLTSLAQNGCNVVAPHFERIVAPRPTLDELMLRARCLRLAIDFAARPNMPIIGVGHSIGATILIAFAGGQMWLGPGQQVPIRTDERLKCLVLFTPPTGFFQAPGALHAVCTPIQLWAGTHDVITPFAQAEFLKQEIGNQVTVDLRVIEGATHFSFMNTLPPQISDTLANRNGFLANLAVEVQNFLA